MEGSAEVAEVVQALEQQYDAFTAGRESLLGDDAGATCRPPRNSAPQFERFLAEQQGRGDPPDS